MMQPPSNAPDGYTPIRAACTWVYVRRAGADYRAELRPYCGRWRSHVTGGGATLTCRTCDTLAEAVAHADTALRSLGAIS